MKDLGVKIQHGVTVTAVESNGVHVCSTSSDGNGSEQERDFIPADLIIVNADLPYATKSLLPHAGNNIPNNPISDSKTKKLSTPRFDWDDSFDFSSGVISFHWSVDKVLGDLNTHNVFMVAGSRSRAESSWCVLRSCSKENDKEQDNSLDSPFNFYVHRASKTDPKAAPNGCDSIMVLVPCKTLLREKECAQLPRQQAIERYKEQFNDEAVSQTREAVLKRLAAMESLEDLRNHILDEVVDTPATYADQYNLAAGTPFALVRCTFCRFRWLSNSIFLLLLTMLWYLCSNIFVLFLFAEPRVCATEPDTSWTSVKWNL